jgi:hypothetical protein
LGQGRDSVRDMLRTDKEMAEKLVTKVKEKAREAHLGVVTPPAADEAE